MRETHRRTAVVLGAERSRAVHRSPVIASYGVQSPGQVAQVSPNFFDVLGVRAALGRTFTPDEKPGGRPVVVLNDSFWRRRFGADAALVG